MSDLDSNAMRDAVESVLSFADVVLTAMGPQVLNDSGRMRLFLFAYMFGAVQGAAVREGPSLPHDHTLALSFFQRCFEMGSEESARVVRWCTDQLASGAPMNAALNAGQASFLRWRADPEVQPRVFAV